MMRLADHESKSWDRAESDLPTDEILAASPAASDQRARTPPDMNSSRALAWAQIGWNANVQRRVSGVKRSAVSLPFFANSVVAPLPPVEPPPPLLAGRRSKGVQNSKEFSANAPRPRKKNANVLPDFVNRASRAKTLSSTRRSGGRAKFRIRVKRCMETEWRSAKMPQLLALFSGLVLPTLDTVTDWAVLSMWVSNGFVSWFAWSLVIRTLSGLCSAATLGYSLVDHFKHTWIVVVVSLTAGFFGLTEWVMVALALYTHSMSDDLHCSIEVQKSVLIVDVCLETLPQSVLQSYVALSYGMINPSDPEKFSFTLLVSLFVSMVHAGTSFFHFEVLVRKQTSGIRLTTFSFYGGLVVFARVLQATAVAFGCGLMFCAFKGQGAIFMVVMVGVFTCSACVNGLRSKPGRSQSNDICAGVLMGACFMLIVIMLGIAFGMDERHTPNNYANSLMPDGLEDDPQYQHCSEAAYGQGFSLVVLLAGLSCVFLVLSWLADPATGVRPIRPRSWEESLESLGASLTGDELLGLKVGAIWTWADTWEDGRLEPREIDRLAQELHSWLTSRLPLDDDSIGDGTSDNVKTSLPEGTSAIDSDDTSHALHLLWQRRDKLIRRRRQNYEMLCSILEIDPFPARFMPPNEVSQEAVDLELQNQKCSIDATKFWFALRKPFPLPAKAVEATVLKIYEQHAQRPGYQSEMMLERNAETLVLQMCLSARFRGMKLQVDDVLPLVLYRWEHEDLADIVLEEETQVLNDALENGTINKSEKEEELRGCEKKKEREHERLATIFLREVVALAGQAEKDPVGVEIFEAIRLPATEEDAACCRPYGCV